MAFRPTFYIHAGRDDKDMDGVLIEACFLSYYSYLTNKCIRVEFKIDIKIYIFFHMSKMDTPCYVTCIDYQ